MTLDQQVQAKLEEGLGARVGLEIREDDSRHPATYFDGYSYCDVESPH